MGAPPHSDDGPLPPGARVEVRTRFDNRRWARGFEVISAEPDGYLLRRLSDGMELPVLFSHHDLRRERRRDTWWF